MLSVAYYNHLKRIHHNCPPSSTNQQKTTEIAMNEQLFQNVLRPKGNVIMLITGSVNYLCQSHDLSTFMSITWSVNIYVNHMICQHLCQSYDLLTFMSITWSVNIKSITWSLNFYVNHMFCQHLCQSHDLSTFMSVTWSLNYVCQSHDLSTTYVSHMICQRLMSVT